MNTDKPTAVLAGLSLLRCLTAESIPTRWSPLNRNGRG